MTTDLKMDLIKGKIILNDRGKSQIFHWPTISLLQALGGWGRGKTEGEREKNEERTPLLFLSLAFLSLVSNQQKPETG